MYLQVRTFNVYSIIMNTKDTDHFFVCPIENTLGILDGKWKITILFFLLDEGTLRFGELKKRIPAITQRMLTAQLRELEDKKIITRKVYPVVPPKVEYSLTPLGRSLEPILAAMRNWSIKNDPHTFKNTAADQPVRQPVN